jgi:tetratricopeptide (TPR) repeat protein
LQPLWIAGGLTVEGRYWIGRAQADLDESAYPQVAAQLWRALAALSDGKRKRDFAERAVALYLSVGDDHGAALALLGLAYALYRMGRLDEAGDANARALTSMRACGDHRGVASCLIIQAESRRLLDDKVAARKLYAQALEAYAAIGEEAGTAAVLANLADLEFADGRVDEALRVMSEAAEILTRGKNATMVATCYNRIAAYRIALGDADGARVASREGLRWARRADFELLVSDVLQYFALLGTLSGQMHDAARLIGYIDARYKEVGAERAGTEEWGHARLSAALRDHLSEAEIEKLAAEGAIWSEDQAVERAMKA